MAPEDAGAAIPREWLVVGRLTQGFVVGVLVGTAWALWTIRRRRGETARPGTPAPWRRGG